MNTDTLLAGKWELAIGNTLIPAQLLGDITPNYEEGTVEAETQAGTRTQPSGKASTAELTFTMYLPSMDYLKVIYSDVYNEPTDASQPTGNVIFGANSCSTTTAVPINIHPVCENTDDNDIHVFAGLVNHTFNPTLSTSDAVAVETTISMQPTNQGYIRLGTGNLAAPSHYDVATQSTVVNGEASS